MDGTSSSGKSVLLRELVKFAQQQQLQSVLLDLKGCLALDELFETLALDVESKTLPKFHSANGSQRKAALLKDLESLAQPLLLGLDTYQDVSADIADWIERQLLRRMEQSPGLVVVISGQKVPDRSRYPWADWALAYTLPPIKEPEHWHDYAKQKWPKASITKEHVEMLLHVSQGDPGQTSALLSSFGDSRG